MPSSSLVTESGVIDGIVEVLLLVEIVLSLLVVVVIILLIFFPYTLLITPISKKIVSPKMANIL